jgi:hypothetical protein
MNGSGFKGLVGGLVAVSLMSASTVAVAATNPAPVVPASQIAPWAALSAMSGGLTASTLCGSSAAIAGAAGAGAGQVAPGGGCVLPQVDAAPPVAQNAPPPPIPIPPVEAASAFAIDPLMLALGALAAGLLVYFLLIKSNGSNNVPNSPA